MTDDPISMGERNRSVIVIQFVAFGPQLVVSITNVFLWEPTTSWVVMLRACIPEADHMAGLIHH
jgi:hypothetical protein